jgi:hypothetical protein
VVVLKVEVEKSIKMGMVALEQLPCFRPNPAPKVVLPKESVVPPPLVTEASGSIVEAGADTGAQAAVKEAVP